MKQHSVIAKLAVSLLFFLNTNTASDNKDRAKKAVTSPTMSRSAACLSKMQGCCFFAATMCLDCLCPFINQQKEREARKAAVDAACKKAEEEMKTWLKQYEDTKKS